MRYTELHIQTRREMPARARTDGERFLIRAGYLDSAGGVTRLGDLAIARLRSALAGSPHAWAVLGPTFTTTEGQTVIETATGSFALLRCTACGYADAEQTAARQQLTPSPEPMLPLQRVETPSCSTIEALASFLGVPPEKTAKALIYTRKGTEQLIFVVVRGDMQASDAKLRAVAGELVAASSDQIAAAGAVPGYASPIGLKSGQVLADALIPLCPNLVTGANEFGYHLMNANYGRDYKADVVADLTLARAGDPCPQCGSPLQAATGRVVADPAGIRGTEALLCLAEAHHDEHGLAFPFGMGASDAYLLHLPSKNSPTQQTATDLHRTLDEAGISVLYDDRDERAGVKFNDADLIGCPVRITVGEKHLVDRMVEFKTRSGADVELVAIDSVVARIQVLSKMPS